MSLFLTFPPTSEIKRKKRFGRRRVLDGRTTKIIRAFLIQRDGLDCYTCGHPPNNAQGILQINHIDGNPENNHPSNLNLMHPRCNRYWFLSQLKIREKEKTSALHDLTPMNASWEARRKLELEDTYAPLLNNMLLKGPVTVKEAEDRLGHLTGSDQQTVRRWVDRETTPEGPYQLSERLVKDKRRMVTLQFISWKPGKLVEEARLSPSL